MVTVKTKFDVTPLLREMLRSFPLARTVFLIAAAILVIFNFGTHIIFMTSPPVYSSWLDVSQSVTDWLVVVLPGVGIAIDDRFRSHAPYLVPLVRNVLAIDFALVFLFASCFAAAVYADIRRDPGRMPDTIARIAERFKLGIPEIAYGSGFLSLIVFLLMYFGIILSPFVSSLLMTMVYYCIFFGGLLLGLTIFIQSGIFFLRQTPETAK
jgi:hypothetical protein